jgi:hypothetical protein
VKESNFVRLRQCTDGNQCADRKQCGGFQPKIDQSLFRFIASTAFAAARAVSAMYVILGF